MMKSSQIFNLVKPDIWNNGWKKKKTFEMELFIEFYMQNMKKILKFECVFFVEYYI